MTRREALATIAGGPAALAGAECGAEPRFALGLGNTYSLAGMRRTLVWCADRERVFGMPIRASGEFETVVAQVSTLPPSEDPYGTRALHRVHMFPCALVPHGFVQAVATQFAGSGAWAEGLLPLADAIGGLLVERFGPAHSQAYRFNGRVEGDFGYFPSVRDLNIRFVGKINA